LDTLLAGQWDDGRIPHIQFHTKTKEYFPGPEAWGRESSSTISNPPVWTLAAEKLLLLGADPSSVTSWIPALERSHLFLQSHRDPLSWNCVATCHPWENGQDNAPAWDDPLEAVDPEEAPYFERVDKKKVTHAGQRPTDTQYKRYLVLVDRFSKNGFKNAHFLVYDPFFTTMTILAEEALQRICDAMGVPSQAGLRASKMRVGLASRLWSPELGRFRYFDAVKNCYLEPYTIGSVSPVLLGSEMEGHGALREALRQDFSTAFGLPSVAPKSPDFDPVCYWRGPTWVNINWLFVEALGEPLLDSTLRLVDKSGFWEYFHPQTGEGLGADRFTWTAALVLDLLNKKEGAQA
jgi:hypothetical protein